MKNCVKCGAENSGESRFCKKCGAELTETAPAENVGEKELAGYSFRPVPDEEIRALVNRKTPLWEKILMTVIAFIIIFGLTFMVCDVRGNQRQKSQIEMLCGKNKTIFLCNGEKVDGSADEDVEYFVSSADGTAAYAIGGSRLYAVTKDGVEKISKNAESAVISPKGNYIFYTDGEKEGYLYNVKKNKSEKIVSGVEAGTAVFSPDGETLVFNKADGMYLYDGGDCEKIDSGVACAAVSDGAKRLYAVSYASEPEAPEKPNASDYEEYDDYRAAYDAYSELYEDYEKALEEYEDYYYGKNICLYYYPSADADKRTKLTDEMLYGAEFNKDISQVVFRDYDGRTYFCKKGGEPERISKDTIYPCSYNDTSFYCGISANEIIGRDSLLNMSYRGGDELWYVDRNCSAEKIDDDISSYTALKISDSGKKVCYADDDGRLYLTDVKSGDSERIAKDVLDYVAEDSMKAFYILDTEGTLYYVKSSGYREKLDKDVYMICSAPSGGIYYLTDDNDLYFAEKDKTEKIDGSGNVLKIESGEWFAMYYYEDSRKNDSATCVSGNGDSEFSESYKDYVPFDYSNYAG